MRYLSGSVATPTKILPCISNLSKLKTISENESEDIFVDLTKGVNFQQGYKK